MSSLFGRITRQHTAMTAAMGQYHPAGTAATPMVMPVQRVTYLPAEPYPWGTAVLEEMQVLNAPDGAAIPAVPPGSHGYVYPAGTMSPAHR